MLRSVTVENFRALQRFSMDGLGRINLIVGGNNSGKTSVLEAICLLCANGDAETLVHLLTQRGELLDASEIGIAHLLPGHRMGVGTQFQVSGQRASGPVTFSALVKKGKGLVLEWRGSDGATRDQSHEISPQGGVSCHALRRLSSLSSPDRPHQHVRFLSTASLSAAEALPLFAEVVLSPEEALLIEALRTIEPDIERVAAVGNPLLGPRAGLFVKLAGQPERAPLGSLGEGMWRLFIMALALVQSKDGILLVDDIDTGLHYSVMTDMWALVKRTAERLNVQVFATTHSRDCYESLASIARPDVSAGSEVSIQRIERGQERAVAFTEQQIVIAADRGIEVR